MPRSAPAAPGFHPDPWARLESPRALAIIVIVTATLAGLAGYDLGYKLGSTPAQPAWQVVFQPGAIQVVAEPR